MITNTVLPKKPLAFLADKQRGTARLATLRSWLLCWEIYLIVLMAAFLRLYQISASEYDNDQANLFQLASYAVTHGLIPATANVSSIYIYIPPATTDILMIPAAFTHDPLWGAITTAILATVSVFLTYCFVRHYYGRVAATIAGLMYATLFEAVESSRTIWNPNLLPLFVVLFMMMLFRGAVARRKGWLFPALFLLGLLIQLHATTVMLIIPFIIALVLAPGTMRWRDLVNGLFSLLIIYFPYLVWEIATHFNDIHVLIQTFLHPQQKTVLDNQAWLLYQALLNPYKGYKMGPFFYNISLFWRLAPYLAWISQILTYLVIVSGITVLILAAWGPSGTNIDSKTEDPTDSDKSRNPLRPWEHVRRYWLLLRASPYRCSLILLLSWQFIPIVMFLRHSIILPIYYFIFLLPGPCILVGIFLAKAADVIPKRGRMVNRVLTNGDKSGESDTQKRHGKSGLYIRGNYVRYSIYALASLIIVAQFISSTAAIVDTDHGNYSDGREYAFAYNDLRSLHNALNEADQLAQRHHLNRVYISTSVIAHTENSLPFLSTQMHTPTTVFDSNCIPLPSTAEGPAVMLLSPYTDLTSALVTQFATATLIDQPRRPGGAPFKLYIVTPKPVQAVPQAQLSSNNGHDLQLDTLSQAFFFNKISWIVTDWSLLHSAPPSDNRTYTYDITMTPVPKSSPHAGTTQQCLFTAMRAGDQVLIPFNQNSLFTGSQSSASSTVNINGQSYETNPLYLQSNLFRYLSFANITTPLETLYTPEHKTYLTIDVPILPNSSPNTPSNKKPPA